MPKESEVNVLNEDTCMMMTAGVRMKFLVGFFSLL